MNVAKCKSWKKICSVMLVMTMIVAMILAAEISTSKAVEKTLGLARVKALGLASSTTYKQTKSKIALKEVSYKQAVKSLELKRKNKTTFRWSPLLNFKFPEALNLSEESEYVYKPAQIQSEIKELKHKLSDTKFAVYEEVSNLFVSIYSYQETIAFQEEQLKKLQVTLEKNQARLVLGQAQQSDIDTIEKSMESLEVSLSENKRKFENEKIELSNLIDLDITTGYHFTNPYVKTELPRSQLDSLVEYTLSNDQSYYEAKMDTQLALLALNENYALMQKQYGDKMKYISSYVQQVKNGEKIDSSAFKLSYDEFLKKIDAPWTGKYKIWFVKFPKEWLKGDIDGVRYVEDEPYVLYENALEYQDVLAEQNQLAKDIEKQVRDDFETQISARNSYELLVKQIEVEEKNLEKMKVLNSLGECTFEEYTEMQNQYEELLMDSLEALQLYTTLLYSYDRLTCGAVSKYFNGAEIEITAASGADSYIVEEGESEKGAKYYITSIIEDSMFELGIYIPEDFETDVTHFELWCDDIQIGKRIEISKKLRHLTLAKDEVEKIFIRLYNGNEFVCDCEIDAQSYEGPLDLPGDYNIVKEEREKIVGNYTTILEETTSLVEITMNFNGAEGISYYTLQNAEGKYIFSEELLNVNTSFRYLAVLSGALENITINCYDTDKNLVYHAYFDTENYDIYTTDE